MVRFALLGMRLRWRLVRNRLRKGGVALFVVVVIGCVGLGLFGLSAFASIGGMSSDGQRTVLVLGFTLLILGWVFVPLLGGGADETVDPTRLALLPLHRRELGAVLAGAAASGPAALAVLVALLGVPIGLGFDELGSSLIEIAVVPVVFLFGIGTARLVSALLVRAQRSRKGRDLAVLVSSLAGVALWLASQSVGPLLADDDSRGSSIVDALAWLPAAWPARAALAADEQRLGLAVGWLLLSIVVAAGALGGWASVTTRLLTASERTIGVVAAGNRPPLGGARTARSAAVAKELRYLRRSPGKRVQFLLGSMMGIGFALIQALQAGIDDDPKVVFFALWGLLFTIAGSFNVVGYDSGSLWLEVVTGGIRREHLAAKTFAWLPLLLIPPVGGSLLIGAISGQWRYVALVIVLAAVTASCGLGVAALVSTIAPMAQTDGDNPFSWRQGMSGKGCITGVYSVGGLLAVGLVAAPVLVPCMVWPGRIWALPLAVVGLAYGAGIWTLGVTLGARRLAGRGPELLAELAPRALA